MFWSSAVPAFLASLVEFVEALTVVLAVGISVNWKSALAGAFAATALLAGLIALFGAAIGTYIPLAALRLVIGLLLILFGAQWLKKALLRFSGWKPFRDESALFQRQLRDAKASTSPQFSAYGFLAAFKSVLLEGLEVAFIVVAFGSTAQNVTKDSLWAAIEGALAALIAVILLGVWLHKPLTKVPENLLKFAVGWILLTFGIFWAGEGLGIEWPLADLFLLVLGAVSLLECAILYRVLSAHKTRGYHVAPEMPRPRAWWNRVLFDIFDFFCGDWWMAGGTAAVVAAACLVPLAKVIFSIGILVAFAIAVVKTSTKRISASTAGYSISKKN